MGRAHKGQAIVLIALAMVGLLAAVALAVDGGNAYAQRRVAQNAADAAAAAGVEELRAIFADYNYPPSVGAPAEQRVYKAIVAALGNSGAPTGAGDFEAWFILRDGSKWGVSQIGQNGGIDYWGGKPCMELAVGVYVLAKARAETYFARIIGVSSVEAAAESAAAFDGVSDVKGAIAGANDGDLMPIILRKELLAASLAPGDKIGQEVLLLCYKQTVDTVGACAKTQAAGTGNWAWLDFTGSSGGADLLGQIANGYDPTSSGQAAHESKSISPTGQWNSQARLNFNAWIKAVPGWNANACDALAGRVASHPIVTFPVTDRAAYTKGDGPEYFVSNIVAVQLTRADCANKKVYGRMLYYGVSGTTVSAGGTLDYVVKYKTSVVTHVK